MQTSEPTAGVREHVHADEEIRWVVRSDRLVQFVDRALGIVVFGLLLTGAAGWTVFTGAGAAFGPGLLQVAATLVVSTAVLVGFVGWPVAWYLFGTTEYVGTDQRLLRYDDSFGTTVDSVPLAGVQDAEFDVTGAERLFAVGTVEVDTGRGYESISFPYAPDPESFAREVTRLAAETRASATAPTATGHGAAASGRIDGAAPESGDGVTTHAGAASTPDEDLDTDVPADGLVATLYSGEELLWVVTPDRTRRFLRSLPAVLVRATGIAVLSGLVALLVGTVRWGFGAGVLSGLAVGGGAWLLVVGTAALVGLTDSTQYAATDRRLIEYRGAFGRELSSVPLAGIQAAEYDLSPVESFLGVGDVTVDTDPDYDELTLSAVANPAAVARDVAEAAEACRAAPRGGSTADGQTGTDTTVADSAS